MIDKSKLPLISIIVTIYNVEQYLAACIEAILQQTYTNLEIILINDGSPDNCGKICDEYRQRDDRIVVVHQENGGVSKARNVGLRTFKGEYMAFVDADDLVHSHYVETLYNNLGKSDFVYCNFDVFTENNQLNLNATVEIKRREILSKSDGFDKLLNLSDILIVVPWNKLYKRELWSGLQYSEGDIHEDEYLIHHLVNNTTQITYIDCVLNFYRQREESITANKKSSISFLDKLSAYYDRYLLFKQNKMNERAAVLLGFILYKCVMKTVSKNNAIWQNVNSYNNILSAAKLPLTIRFMLLLKKINYSWYSQIYARIKK